MKKKLAIIITVALMASIAMTACSKDKGPKDDGTTGDLQNTSVVINMDTSLQVDAGTVLNIMDIAQVKEEKSALVDKFGFMVDGTTFQENYTVIEGKNEVTVVAQFTDGEQFVEMLTFTGSKSESKIPTDVLSRFKGEDVRVSHGLTFTNIDGYTIQDVSTNIDINTVAIEDIITYVADDPNNDIERIVVQSINGTKEDNNGIPRFIFGTMMNSIIDETSLATLLSIEGNDGRLTQTFDKFYNEATTLVTDETIIPAKFYSVNGDVIESPVETTFMNTEFISDGNRVPLTYTQYITTDDYLIGITYVSRQLSSSDEGSEKELPSVKIDEAVFEQDGVKTLLTKAFEGVTSNNAYIGVKTLKDVSFLGNSIIVGELSLTDDTAEIPVEDNTVEVEDNEPVVDDVVDIKETQRKPYSERHKEFYTWPKNSKYTYNRYVYILSGLTDDITASTFTGSITDKKNGGVKMSGGGSDNTTSINTETGTNKGTSSSGDNDTSNTIKTSSIVGSSGRSYKLSNESLEGVSFDEMNATAGMTPITFGGDKYYITAMTPTEISRLVGSTGTKPDQSLYPVSNFKSGDFLVVKDNSVTDGTTCYNVTYTSIEDGTKKTAPYMACLPTISSQDWLVIYGDKIPESMNVLRTLLTDIVVK